MFAMLSAMAVCRAARPATETLSEDVDTSSNTAVPFDLRYVAGPWRLVERSVARTLRFGVPGNPLRAKRLRPGCARMRRFLTGWADRGASDGGVPVMPTAHMFWSTYDGM